MANVVPFSFAQELLKGSHNFTSNTIKLALYTANPYTTASTQYTTGSANQVSGTGYTTGGNTLSNPVVANQSNVATLTFDAISWTSATFGAAYGVIYNDDKSDKLVVVLDFGGTKTATNGDFTIVFPDPSTPSNAIKPNLVASI